MQQASGVLGLGHNASATRHSEARAWKCGTQAAAAALAGSAPRWFAGSLRLPVPPSRLMFSSSTSTPPHFRLPLICSVWPPLPCRHQSVTVCPSVRHEEHVVTSSASPAFGPF
ncbi:hypothetical protein BDA96_05G144800 [Sorghum bicolor]|uniref:Uncharacterized protein n=2 Tax=Sorghum bicolor TaxID=4558 RepID=A0A921QXW6_SORBI|nr:hypothetical protein BDA96_05G144800 [Sorghum bicolor]OQU83532.1 hypothetical protein SORBI_3005G131550 [Sorghum bicolor]